MEGQGSAGEGIHAGSTSANITTPPFTLESWQKALPLQEEPKCLPNCILQQTVDSVGEQTWVSAARNKPGAVPTIDVGSYKVLGKGKLPYRLMGAIFSAEELSKD
jgi:hypothetical protein